MRSSLPFLLLLVAACGGATTEANGSSGGSSSSGASSSGASSSGASSSGASSSSGSSSSGSSSDGPAVPSTAAKSLCASSKLNMELPSGQSVSFDRQGVGGGGGGGRASFFANAAGGAFVRLEAAASSFDVGSSIAGPALFQAAASSPGPAPLSCASSASAVTYDAQSTYRFTLRGTVELAACSTAPTVSGSVKMCLGDCGADATLSGTIDGKNVAAKTLGYEGTVNVLFPSLDSTGIVLVATDDSLPYAGLLYLSGDDVYCAAQKTYSKTGQAGNERYDITLTDLRHVGSCAGASASSNVEGCAE